MSNKKNETLTINKPMLKTRDIMKHLGLSREKVLQLLRAGVIPSMRFGESGEFRVDSAVYESWYKQNYGGTIWAS